MACQPYKKQSGWDSRKLGKTELIDIVRNMQIREQEMNKQMDELRLNNKALRVQLEDRQLLSKQSKLMADVAVTVNNVLSASQNATKTYFTETQQSRLDLIQKIDRMSEIIQLLSESMVAKTESECAKIRQETEQACNELRENTAQESAQKWNDLCQRIKGMLEV